MNGYAAPLAEMRFALDAIAGLGEIAALPGYAAAAAPETVDAILEAAAKFAGEVLAPLNAVGDRERARLETGVVHTPTGFKAAYDAFVAGGWNGLALPEEHGGQGLPLVLGIAVLEMWTSANLAFSLCPILTQAAAELLIAHGSAEQRRLYLDKLMRGEWTGTMNLTEPQAGSDLGAVRMRAVKDGDRYRLSGQKIFITYGEHDLAPNIVHAVLARTPDAPPGSKGLSLFLVPKFLVNADGGIGARNDVRCLKLEEKLGIHASPTCVLSYGDDNGAIGTLIGEEGRGLEYMFLMMNGARLNVGLQGVAVAERAYQQARDYARHRVQGRPAATDETGELPIIRHPDVRRMLLAMRSDAEATRALLYYTAGMIDRARREPDATIRAHHQARADLLIPVAKAWSTERGFEAASTNIQIHGGMGYIEETGAAQHLRDARIALIYEGTNGIQANDLLTRKLARDGGAAMRDLIAAMRALDSDLAGESAPSLTVLRPHLRDGIGALAAASEKLLAAYRVRPERALAGAVPYLELFGTVAAGWLMAKAALAAWQRRSVSAAAREFCDAKLVTARFFAEHRLAKAPGLLPSIGGGETVMNLDPDLL
ncbi:MAG TPA: acyl-CoA dehydrogenase [Stellaceae bacterium]|nr:acyl-CoA dehydrogenase [Stellaceae bacterium]